VEWKRSQGERRYAREGRCVAVLPRPVVAQPNQLAYAQMSEMMSAHAMAPGHK
jgi:hypothetical protein